MSFLGRAKDTMHADLSDLACKRAMKAIMDVTQLVEDENELVKIVGSVGIALVAFAGLLHHRAKGGSDPKVAILDALDEAKEDVRKRDINDLPRPVN